MSDAETLHYALLRPAIIQILRAAGFHSTKPTVLDTLTDLAARYLHLISQQTASLTYDRTAIPHNYPPTSTSTSTPPLTASPTTASTTTEPALPIPTLPDILTALATSNAFTNTLTPSEEAWRETLRRPLPSYPPGAAREKERRRRDAEDVRDVRDFVDWCTGPVCAEARRVAGVETGVGAVANTGLADAGEVGRGEREDYIGALKKKYSRVGDGSRYGGTVLGRHGREEAGVGVGVGQGLRIEGGPETLGKWRDEVVKRRRVESANANAALEAARKESAVEVEAEVEGKVLIEAKMEGVEVG